MDYSNSLKYLRPVLRFVRSLLIVLALILLGIGAWWTCRLFSRPWRTPSVEELSSGVRYEKGSGKILVLY